ncbi:SAM-dependent methyltransferase [Nocardia sp. NPDC050435]|uniref:SAM-dependent methyltransferase n=1 Tax=Nocardia sp. NPDC050435 TaxID=3155040 RepID=UPI00340F266B
MSKQPDQTAVVAALPDPSRPHSGRIHDFLLDGKDYYSADSTVGVELVGAASGFRNVAREARAFLLRAVGYTVQQGVTQILELGSGYPCEPNVHETAQQINPEARTLYIDNDPIVAAHGRAMLADKRTQVVDADITDATAIIDAIEEALDPRAPITMCCSFVLEFVESAQVVQTLIKTLPAGSAVVLSHITADLDGEIATRAAQVYAAHGIDFYPRSRREIADLLTGCDLAEPGLVAPQMWRPLDELARWKDEQWQRTNETGQCCYAAVGWVR